MGYQALLFCPDEKLARVVSQVFTELDFTVDPVHEPFAAVKKLMAQRFDALVVDCENEQNASLLFKSARNSSSNQSSLAIALVEGQAGVAKAYRIGANLVLTKPINVEQAKGTLRVARGLLRKNSDAASAPTTSTVAPAMPPPSRQTSSDYSSPSSSAPAPTRAPLSFAASAPVVSSVPADRYSERTGSQHNGSQHNEFEDQAAAIVPDMTPTQIPAMSASAEVSSIGEIKSEPKVEDAFPEKLTTENTPTASVRSSLVTFSTAPEGSADVTHSFPGAKQTTDQVSSTPFASASTSNTTSPAGSAAAAAPAREAVAAPLQNPAKESVSAPMPAAQQPVLGAPAFVFDAAPTSDSPSFGSLSGGEDSDGSGSNKKMLIAAAAVLAFAALGYLGYTKMSGDHTTPAPQPVSASQSFGQPSSAPATPSSPSTSPSVASAKPNSAALSTAPATATPKIAISSSPEKGAVGGANPPTIHIGVDTPTNTPTANSASGMASGSVSGTVSGTKKPASTPIQVKSNDAGSTQSDDSAPALPLSSTTATFGATSLSSLMSSSSSSPSRPTLATVRISQGVSQGLVIKRVQPKYPAAALASHTAGAVQIEATVSKDGTVTNAKAISGDLVLAHAALEAVRQWRYKPYYLDGAPVEIQTQITVNFKAN
jgi:TonB family protein